MTKHNIIKILLIINLAFLSILLFSKMYYFHKLIRIFYNSFITPFIFSMFLFYIIKPLNTIFIKKGLKPNLSALLTLIFGITVLTGTVIFFSNFIGSQLNKITEEVTNIFRNKNLINVIMNKVSKYIPAQVVSKTLTNISNTYTQNLAHTLMIPLNYTLHIFSTLLLMLLILFYLLKDGSGLKEKFVCRVPEKYKKLVLDTLTESDRVLYAYVTGQAKVALALSFMIFVSYKFIGIPNAFILSLTTFILAFIPFIGFFISMIIPTIIALSMGFVMIGKLMIVFILVQTLKGRVVVPAIMANAMKIHPLTDISLVIGAIAVGGPMAAFAVVPIYAILKVILTNMYKYGIIKKYNT